MTVMETIFRLLLARGNQPVPSEEIAQQLSQLRGKNVYPHTVEQVLSQEPRFYGIRGLAKEVEEEEVEGPAETDTVAVVEAPELDTGTAVGAEAD